MPPRYRTPAASSSPCNAIFSSKGEIMPPYEQCWVMRSARRLTLAGAVAAAGRCALSGQTRRVRRQGGAGTGDEVFAGADAELVEDVPEVEFDGFDADVELGCCLAVGAAGGDEAGHRLFGR